MEQSERLVLQRNRVYISENVTAKRVVDALFAQGLIDGDDKEEILAETTNSSKVCELLDILPRKGPQAFAVFLRTLPACGSGHVARFLQSKLTGESVEEGYGEEPICFGLPKKIPKFIGRKDDCEKITNMLMSENMDGMKIVTIVGPPGFGKTVLAKMVGHKIMADLGRDVLYISLRTVTKMMLVAENILNTAGFPVGTNPVLDVTQYLVLLQRPTVLILDNAEDLCNEDGYDTSFICFLKELSEQATNLVTLVTSRRPLSNLNHYFFPTNFPLRPLTEEQSFLFLKTHAPSITDQVARRFSCHRVCGGVPLVLKLTASFLEKKTIDPVELHRNLQNCPHKFLKLP